MDPLRKVSSKSFDVVRASIPEAFKTEGFGILTEIDVKETLKKKLDVDFRSYRILGACNPSLAKQALDRDLDVGHFLPCSVAVYEDDEGRTVVSAVDPILTIAAAGDDPVLRKLASEVREKLVRAVSRVE